MESVIQTMINCISYEVCGGTEKIVLPECSMQFLTKLYKLSKAHDVAHLVGDALNKLGILDSGELKNKFDKQIYTAVYRYENINVELEEIRRILRAENVDFIPLKGSVIRCYYPEPWMRTSSDIDILIKSDQLKLAISTLIDRLSYEQKGEWIDEISLYSPSGVHVELHCTLVADCVIEPVDNVLSDIWTYAERVEGTSEYELKDEAYYYYHIAHMAKHVMHGGCGVRPFIDLWLLEHKIEHSNEKRNTLLECGGLSKFAEVSRALSKVWFDGDKQTDVTREFEHYIFRGGVYGTNTNRIAIQRQKHGGKFKYVFSRIFIPYEEIKFYYPILQKHKWLTPIMEVRRWGKLIFCGHLKRTVKELKYNNTISDDAAAETRTLLKNIGL